jgi:nitroreductase
MDVLEAVRKRHTIRKFKNKEIPRKDLSRLLESARLAPSGMNLQPWELVVVTAPAGKEALVEPCMNQHFVGECSVVIAGLDDPKAKWARVDLALAFENIVLAATELGLGCCFIGAFSEQKVKTTLGIPPSRAVTMLLAVGYSDERTEGPQKKSLEQLVHWEKY